MIINTNYPFFKHINRVSFLHVITHLTARNDVFRNVSLTVVHPVNSIVNIRAATSVWMINLLRLYAAVVTILRSYTFKQLYIKRKFVLSVFSIVFCISIESPKRTFVSWKTAPASTTRGKSPAQRTTFGDFLISAIALAKKLCWVSRNSFQHSQLTVLLSNNINVVGSTTPAIILRPLAKLCSPDYNFLSTITYTKPFSTVPVSRFFGFFNNQKFSIPISNFVNRFHSHIVLLNGDLRKSWRRYRGDIRDFWRSQIKETPSDLFASIVGL